ncbi:tRNA (adenine(22)-N(1))-methyltransferase [compost metagenome]
MKVKLSKRLQMIADRVPSGSRLADIGSDHALLPTYLAQSGVITFAIAGEVNPGPLEAASRQVSEAGLSKVIEVRGGNGLAVLEPNEVDIITIAGMGGSLITTILNEGLDKLNGVKRLVLQPNVGEEHVRRWLDEQDWQLESEAILEEDGKIYEILTAVRATDAQERNAYLYRDRQLSEEVLVNSDRLKLMGPYLLEEADEVWFDKWDSELAKLEMIRSQLALSLADASKVKAEAIAKEIREIKEVLACLQKVKP